MRRVRELTSKTMRTMREPEVEVELEMMLRWYSATTLETSRQESRSIEGHDLEDRAILTAQPSRPTRRR